MILVELQALLSKMLPGQPRTRSRSLTYELSEEFPLQVAATIPFCSVTAPVTTLAELVRDRARVHDHPAVVPTARADLEALESRPYGESEIWMLRS